MEKCSFVPRQFNFGSTDFVLVVDSTPTYCKQNNEILLVGINLLSRCSGTKASKYLLCLDINIFTLTSTHWKHRLIETMFKKIISLAFPRADDSFSFRVKMTHWGQICACWRQKSESRASTFPLCRNSLSL